jgi:hypothetical protein
MTSLLEADCVPSEVRTIYLYTYIHNTYIHNTYILTYLVTYLLTYLLTYILIYLLTYLLHGTESFLRS